MGRLLAFRCMQRVSYLIVQAFSYHNQMSVALQAPALETTVVPLPVMFLLKVHRLTEALPVAKGCSTSCKKPPGG